MKIAGFGFRAAATEGSLQDALAACNQSVDALAAPTDKSETPLFRTFAANRGLPVIAIPENALKAQQTATQSVASQAARETGSVAEASALAGAGANARLVTARQISQDRLATCAVAEGYDP